MTNNFGTADDEYDLVIEGTGLTESILAAAASWVGKRVLHVDANTFYGSHWAALSLNQIDTWAQNNSGKGISANFKPSHSLSFRQCPLQICPAATAFYFHSHPSFA